MRLAQRIGQLLFFWAITTSLPAQTYPERPFTWVVAFTPGSSTDTLTRLLAQKLSHRTRQPVIVANRLGAGGLIGARSVATTAPDGYTLPTHGPAIYGYPVFSKEPPLRMPGDLEPVGFLVDVANV
jgi:tripartite-type tricarboxylate transporter receptor subunit TctC